MTGLTKKSNLINAVYFCNLVNVFLEQQQKKHGEEKIGEYE